MLTLPQRQLPGAQPTARGQEDGAEQYNPISFFINHPLLNALSPNSQILKNWGVSTSTNIWRDSAHSVAKSMVTGTYGCRSWEAEAGRWRLQATLAPQ